MRIIAHGIKNPQEARQALRASVDFLEVDASKRLILTKFTTQHHGIKGKLGIGESLEPILSAISPNKLFLDIKHANSSLTFTKKFSDLLIDHHIKNARICGLDWQIISEVCQKTGCLPFYTLAKEEDFKKLKKKLAKLIYPRGFPIRHSLIDKSLIVYLKSIYPRSGIWVWTVNDIEESKRLEKLGVDGIITDQWEKFTNL